MASHVRPQSPLGPLTKEARGKSEKEVTRDMRDAYRGGYIASKLEIWENIH